MKTLLALSPAILGGFAALPLYAAPAAQATPAQDSQYVACVAQDSIYDNQGPTVLASLGRQYASDIAYGIRTGPQEDYYVYRNTGPSITQTDANWLVNCAVGVYSGWGPDSAWFTA